MEGGIEGGEEGGRCSMYIILAINRPQCRLLSRPNHPHWFSNLTTPVFQCWTLL